MHPLLAIYQDAAAGRFPDSDGGVTYLPALGGGLEAVVCFTGHAFIASRLGPDDLSDLEPDGLGGALHPEILLRMAGPGGRVGSIDLTMFATGRGGGVMEPSPELDDHPRVVYARARREGVRVYGDEDGLFTMASGLGGRLDAYPGELSGGEQRRVALARALVHAPQVVLADEPTADLDEETEAEVLAVLRDLARDGGSAVVLVTHRLDAARRADRVVEVRQGRLEPWAGAAVLSTATPSPPTPLPKGARGAGGCFPGMIAIPARSRKEAGVEYCLRVDSRVLSADHTTRGACLC